MSIFLKRIAFLVYLFISVSAFGQQREEEIEVSDERQIEAVTVSTSASVPAVKQSAPVQIIGRDKLENLGMSNLHEAVRTFSGVNITDYGGLGGVKTVSVRSLGAHHTAVSYDGVVVSNAQGGQVDIGSFTLDNIEEVSLTIGQGDEIFQSARNFESSGVLNIRSSQPHFGNKVVRAGAQLTLGSFGYYNPMLDLAVKLAPRWSIKGVVDWMTTDGEYPFTLVNGSLISREIRENSDVNRFRSEVNIYGNVGRKGGRIYIKGNYLDSERGLPGSIILYKGASDERLWDKTRFLQAGYSVDLNEKWSIKSFAKYNYAWNKYIDWDKKYQDGYMEDRYTQQEYYLSGSVRFRPTKRWSFSFAQDLFENMLVTTHGDCPDPYRLSILSALAAQYQTERLTVTTSLLGVINTEWALNDTYEIAPNREHISPSISASYKLLAEHDLKLRASVKDAYRVPTFNDLYYSSMGNTKLRPEKAMQYNLGVTYGGRLFPELLDYVTLSADAYYNKISDKIVAKPSMFIWRMMNLGEVEIQGLDLNLSTYFTPVEGLKVNLSGNYTYQHAIDVTDPEAKNYRNQIQYTPRHSGNVALTLQHRWFNVGYTATMVGKRYCLPQNIETNLIKGYIDQNININREFSMGTTSISVQAEVLNLFNVNYDVIKYYPMPGRQYRLNVKFLY